MPVFDGSTADHYHRQDRIFVTRRLIDGMPPAERAEWFQAPKVHLNYHRRAHELANVPIGQALRLIRELKLTSSHNVLLVGAGFAWVSEELVRLGISTTSTDSSPWIHSVKGTDEAGEIEAALDLAGVTLAHKLRASFLAKLMAGPRATEVILEEDALSNGSRQRLRNEGTFTHIITSHVLTWLHDDEAVKLSDALHQINVLAQVVHYVGVYKDDAAAEPEPEPFSNWKRIVGDEPVVTRLSGQAWYTTNSWPSLLPDDTFVGV